MENKYLCIIKINRIGFSRECCYGSILRSKPTSEVHQSLVFDRIEVRGCVFIGPAKETHHNPDFERPTEEISFSLVGAWHRDYKIEPHMLALANYCSGVTGRAGFYGLASARRVD